MLNVFDNFYTMIDGLKAVENEILLSRIRDNLMAIEYEWGEMNSGSDQEIEEYCEDMG